MNKRGFVMMFTAVLFVLLFSCDAEAEDLPKFDDSSVIVVTKPDYTRIRMAGAGGYEDILARLGITDTRELMDLSGSTENISLLSETGGSIVKLTLPEAGEDKVLEAVDALNASGAVKYAEPNYYYYLNSIPNDPIYLGDDSAKNYQFGIVDAEAVWNMDIDCSGVTVAVLDSGIFAQQEDIADNIWVNPDEIPDNGEDDDNNGYTDDVSGWDFSKGGDNDPDDGYNTQYPMQGHGTHVSGVISAVTGNGVGTASLAGSIESGGAKIVPLKVFYDAILGGSRTKTTDVEILVEAINYVKKMNIPIANCSWCGIDSDAMKEAIQSCESTLFVAAAGNSGANNDSPNTVSYPAQYDFDNVISVGASTAEDKLAYFSNYGDSVDVAAPGDKIWSTANTNLQRDSYKQLSGTSQATPLVSSMAAVLKGKYPSFTPADIKKCITGGADAVDTMTYSGHYVNGNRRLSASGAMRYAEEHFFFEITWLGDDGSVIDSESVMRGSIPSHAPVEKEADDEYVYTFDGWDPEPSAVTEDTAYTTRFTKTLREYTITWKDESGNVLETDSVPYGEMPEYNGEYDKEPLDGYYVNVPVWEPDITEVVGDAEYTLKYITFDTLDVSARITDDNGTEVKKGDSPPRITAYIDFPNTSARLTREYSRSVEPFTVILAVYDENGALTGFSEKTVNEADMLETVTLCADNNKAIDSVRIYMWNKIGSMLPIRNAKDVL